MQPTKARYFIETFLQREIAAARAKGAKNCLNIGCGITGRYAPWLAEFDVDGVDVQTPDEPMPWRYHQGDAAQLPFADDTFDLAIAIESFEHIEANTTAMQEAFRTLKPGGKLILTVPTHYTWPFEFGHHGPHYYTRAAIQNLIAEAGFRITQIYAGGGLLYYLSSLGKNYVSPLGRRVFGARRWWPMIDSTIWPFYALASIADKFLPILPCNWLIGAVKPPL